MRRVLHIPQNVTFTISRLWTEISDGPRENDNRPTAGQQKHCPGNFRFLHLFFRAAEAPITLEFPQFEMLKLFFHTSR